MGTKSKIAVTVVLVGAVTTAIVMQSNSTTLFQGKLLGQEQPAVEKSKGSDLVPKISLEIPSDKNDDITVTAEIANEGEFAILGGEEFFYTLKINNEEVLTNSDAYSELAPGDAFSFKYPIPKSIYNYQESGEISFEVDTKNAIDETNEDNNKVTAAYKY